MRFIRPFFFYSLVICFGFAGAQQVKGTITDKDTQEPIPFANVFFSGTLIGATSDIDGNFSFEIPEEGKYELIVSYVGYEEYSREVLTSEELPFFEIELEPEVIKLEDVQVEADTSGWKQNYPVFKQLFLGGTQNALKVDIVNPKDIFLFFDKVENGLFAHARKEILIENSALGYKLGYSMQEFRMEYRSRRFYSFGIPRFVEMKPKGKGQMKRWNKARVKAYNGSFNHFLRSFKNNTFSEEGFLVQELFRIPNKKRPPESVIKKNLAKYGATTGNTTTIVIGGSTASSDSLNYWMRMRRLPEVVDSLGMIIRDNQLMQGDIFNYKGHLKIIYTKEPEEPGFSRFRRGGGTDNKQTSIVYFSDPLTIYENGYYDVAKVFFEGYMGWSSKIAEMLPLEYVPQKE